MKLFGEEMKKNEKMVTAYTLPCGFVVEVERHEEISEFYLSHEDYGDKMFMFGIRCCDITTYEEIIRGNAIEYIGLYFVKYMAA